MSRVTITFAHYPEGREQKVPEDFEWVQLTYTDLIVARNADDNGQEFACFRNGFWEYEGVQYTDVIIGAEQ